MIVDGVEWLPAAELLPELGDDVTPEMLWDWKRRKLVRAVRVGRINFYDVGSALAAEEATFGRTRPRRGGSLPVAC